MGIALACCLLRRGNGLLISSLATCACVLGCNLVNALAHDVSRRTASGDSRHPGMSCSSVAAQRLVDHRANFA